MQAETTPFVFNPFAPGHDADPTTAYRRLREEAPVYWWERGQAFLVSKYDDIVALMKDPRFSRSPRDGNHYQPIPDIPEFHEFRVAQDHSLLNVGALDHLRQRRLVNGAFSPRAAEAMRVHTREITQQALARLPDDDVVDLAPLTDYIPLRVIGRMLAIPPAQEESFLNFARARVELISPGLPQERREQLMHAIARGYRELKILVDERRERPGSDLLSTLIHHSDEGLRLSSEELMGLLGAIVIAGSDTTVHTLRFMLLNLLRRPDQLAIVRRDPTRLRAAMEETLRFDQFGRFGAPCYALEDVTIRGVQIRRRQMVIPMTGAGTLDPDVFTRADEFDIDRPDLDRARNFGAGPHTCLGIHLARIEAEEVMGPILERFPEMSLAGSPEFTPHFMFRVISKLPVRVRAAT